jgi:hypothetical protein
MGYRRIPKHQDEVQRDPPEPKQIRCIKRGPYRTGRCAHSKPNMAQGTHGLIKELTTRDTTLKETYAQFRELRWSWGT